jgi:hypothetical protein
MTKEEKLNPEIKNAIDAKYPAVRMKAENIRNQQDLLSLGKAILGDFGGGQAQRLSTMIIMRRIMIVPAAMDTYSNKILQRLCLIGRKVNLQIYLQSVEK